MQNQVYTTPYQPYYPQQSCPSSGVAAVNIQIFNPTANSGQSGFYQPVSCAPYPCNYNNISMAQPYSYANAPMVQQNPAQPMPSQNSQTLNETSNNQQLALNQNQEGVAAQANGANGEKTEKEKEAKPKVALTDNYIKTLENYLNSQDKKVRLMGAKELLERFKEDETRKDDPALTALLNKTLQDPAETVKFIGLTALDTGYANGNDETAQILTQMQSSNSSYGEDAALATQVLLKMSGNMANAEAAAQAGSAEISGTNSNTNLSEKMPPDNSGVLQNEGVSLNQNAAIAQNSTQMSQTAPADIQKIPTEQTGGAIA